MISKPKKRKMNPMLLNVLLISGGVHAVALFILGSITVYKYIVPSEAQFEEPPVVEQVEPPKEVKVEIRPQAAPQQQSMQNLRMKQVGNITVANVDVDLPSMEQSFTVSSGLGGFGGGALLGGTRGSIGIGMSDISVFGLKSKAERVLFAIDASRTMLTDKKGGLHSYRVIKEEITTMVSNLSTGTLFNVVFYNDGRLLFFKPRPVPAGDQVTQELINWVAPINSDINKLGAPGAKKIKIEALPEEPVHIAMNSYQHSGGNETAYLTQVFLEQSIDAVFVIAPRHSGFQRIARPYTQKESEAWKKRTSDPRYQEQLKEHNKERAELVKKAREIKAERDAERKKRGLPPQIFDGGDFVRRMGLSYKTNHPGGKPTYYIEERDVVRYFKDLTKVLYKDKNGTPPSINVVLFLAGDEKFSESNEDRLKDYTRFFGGKFRIIRGLDGIKAASSSKDTKN
ncbi:hypothetical protein QEH52_17675 [Coraliomargarita sp. SDUM461003]|uniref:VWFA domain-containing protein n=1 Tax=Thalassobacterium maritimum TaxID=3041265 RepID=A0ABU1B1N2_9BACT|nr:hypothetical protein [Coraliomargarita sp. SDUM461003]MDQ8209362.1 hypothetical protein [Coraliomargarita sp. SDUM461003]